MGDSKAMERSKFDHGPMGLRTPKESWQDRFAREKGKLTKQILSSLYNMGLGYTSAQESFNEHNDKLFREVIVDAQAKQRGPQNPTQLFLYICIGDFDTVVQKLDEIEMKYAKNEKSSQSDIENSDIYAKDVSGANIVHVAYLFQQYEIGRYLVQRYPELASQPYGDEFTEASLRFIETKGGPECNEKLTQLTKLLNGDKEQLSDRMPYSGENVLHIVIVRRDFEEVRWLLNFYRDHKYSCPQGLSNLLTANAKGKFFDTKGDLNFGGYPLQFAVCSNDTKIFDLVYTFASTMEEEDVEWGEEEEGGVQRCRSNGGLGGGWDEDGEGGPMHIQKMKSVLGTEVTSKPVGPNVLFQMDLAGNNVLHLCVIHSLKDMYEHVYNTALGVLVRALKIAYAKAISSDKKKVVVGDLMDPLESLDQEDHSEGVTGYRLRETTLMVPHHDKLDEWATKEAKIKLDERMQSALNALFHSPLTLSASIIQKNKTDSEETIEKRRKQVEMFEYLLSKSKQPMWSYGPVNMSLLNLNGVGVRYQMDRYDIAEDRRSKILNLSGLRSVAGWGVEGVQDISGMHSAIDWLCINDADAAILIPEVGKLIQTKWERVGYPFFVLSFLLNLALAVLMTFILVFVNATPTTSPGYVTEYLVNFLYAVVAMVYFIMFIQETFNFVVFGAQWFVLRGVARFDKAMRIIKILSFVAFCCMKSVSAYRGDHSPDYPDAPATVLYNKSDDAGIKVTLTICIITSWVHMYYYFMGFDKTGPFMLTMFRIIQTDVPFFFQFYSIVVFAFACALSMLSNNGDYRAGFGFMALLKACWTLIQDTVSVTATHDNINEYFFFEPYLQWLADILLTGYYAIVNILMLNLLIAMISDTYSAYTSYNNAILLIAKYNIMHAMEKVMWDDELRDNRSKYTMVQDHRLKTQEYDFSHVAKPSVSIKHRLMETKWSLCWGWLCGCFGGGGASVGPIGGGGRGGAAGGSGGQWQGSGQGPGGSGGQGEGKSSTGRRRKKNVNVTDMSVISYTFELEITEQDWWDTTQIRLDHASRAERNKTLPQTALFIIDPQNDFHTGSLAVPGASEDAIRTAKMIDNYGDYIHEIFVSMDSHYPCHIAHACAWVSGEDFKTPPKEFSTITNQDVVTFKWIHIETLNEVKKEMAAAAAKAVKAAAVEKAVAAAKADGTWKSSRKEASESGEEEVENEEGNGQKVPMWKWVKQYTSALQRKSKMKLIIWPEHCIIGSRGHGIVPVINDALQRWAEKHSRPITYIMKGQNLRTEMYSALMAEVEDSADPSTALNTELLNSLKISDRILICGQALSHCVNATTRDLIDHLGKERNHLVLLKDACSSVKDFEVIGAEFLAHCERKNVGIETTESAFLGYKPADKEED